MDNQTQTKLWSVDFVVVSAINLFVLINYYMLLVTIGNYVVDTFAASKSIAGLVTGMMVIGCLVGRFITGFFLEMIGCKKALFVGIIGFIITMALYLTAFNLPLLILIRFISGIFVGVIGTVTGTIVVYVVPPNRRGEGISYFSLSTILATALGPFAGILLVQYVHFNILFYFGIVIGAICLFIAYQLKANKLVISKPQTQANNQRASWLQLSSYIEPSVLRISFIVMLVSIGYATIQAYLSFYAQELDLMEAASFFFAIYAIFILISRPFSGRLFDLKGENVIIYPTLLLLTIGFIVLSVAYNTWLLLLSSALIGLGFGNFQSTAQAIAVKVAPHHKVGQATSTYFILFDFGIGLGPYFMGLLIPYIRYHGLYLVCALISLLAIVLYFFLHGNHKPTITILEES
ncbi:MFS transporter [uncultured Gilliamella sp.]|uniref:MFS transporter n=1 Tax=uncultured Gilliamella sp. TaxID=1193505 RepID=UPI0025F10F4B|nr:MFS transporter [uncultured Gilliamella sp.]